MSARNGIILLPARQTRRAKRCRAAAAMLVALFCMAAAPAAVAQQTMTLRLGYNANSARNMAQVPYVAVQRKGFLAREHIAITMVPLMGTTNMVAALDKGEVDATGTASPYMIEAALRGSDAVAVIGGVANPIYSLIAKPEIKSAADLKGKLVAISAPPDTITLSTRMLLAKAGLQQSDYRTKEIIGSTQRADCLTSGECDAVPLGQPDDIVLMQKGYHKLGDSLEVVHQLQFNVIATDRSWAAAHKDVVTALAKAFGATFRYLRDPANRDDVAKLIVDTTGVTEQVARDILALYYEPDRGVMPKQGEINMAGLNEVIALLAATGQIAKPLPDANRFVDLQYLRAAGLQ
jgi:ABC-type nitrate/sulfonate/bicarbonate transport system substrate-binding protein